MKKLIYLCLLLGVTSCYEYRKLPNTKRVKKSDVRKAMKYSTWQYDNRAVNSHRTSYHY